MGAIYNASFLILCAFLSPEIVLASDDSLELSSVSHIRQKRMDPSPLALPGTLSSHQLPPLLAYDLRTVNMTAPTVVVITRNGNKVGSGYAIHPYLVLTRKVYVRPQYECGVSTNNRRGGGHTPQRIQHIHQEPDSKFVMIQLQDPIFLDEPVHGALLAAKFPVSATDLAYRTAIQWIPGQLIHLRPLLRQNLNEVYLGTPTKVHVTSSNRPSPGNGYAVHPYIVVTRPAFAGSNANVISLTSPTGDPKPHRIQFRYLNRALNVQLLELLDPILMTNGVPGALTAENYSAPAIAWALQRAEEWKRTRLQQPNFYQENAV